MSSDGETPTPRPQRPARPADRNVGQWAMALLLVLAVVATVVMVLTDSRTWMRVATLSALWSAFIGAALVARYRKQAAGEASRVRDLHTVYELQLEREISARREHELVVEKQLRDSVRAETDDSILALRREILALREQLGALTGTPLGDDVAAVGSARSAQLGSAPQRTTVPSERVSEPRPDISRTDTARPDISRTDTARSDTSRTETARPDTSRGDVTPSTERTSSIPPVAGGGPAVRPARGPVRSDPFAGFASAPSGAGSTGAVPSGSFARVEPQASGGWTPPAASRDDWGTDASTTGAAPDTSGRRSAGATDAAGGTPAAEEEQDRGPRGRHEEGAGNSVADLMARLAAGQEPSGGGRRRRHSQD